MNSRGEKTRGRMVRGALALMRERGYSGTGFRELIDASGAPRGSIYHHFPGGKAQLAKEVVTYAGELGLRAVDEALRSGDPVGALRSFIELWRSDFERTAARAGCPIAAVAVEVHDDAPELLEAADAAFGRWLDAFAESLEAAGVNSPKARGLATLVVSGVEGGIILSRARRSPAPLLEVAGELEVALRAAIAAN